MQHKARDKIVICISFDLSYGYFESFGKPKNEKDQATIQYPKIHTT